MKIVVFWLVFHVYKKGLGQIMNACLRQLENDVNLRNKTIIYLLQTMLAKCAVGKLVEIS